MFKQNAISSQFFNAVNFVLLAYFLFGDSVLTQDLFEFGSMLGGDYIFKSGDQHLEEEVA